MALGNTSPFRPYLILRPVLADGRRLTAESSIYKIPYNYLQRFSLSYAKNSTGDFELELFDINYDDILLQLMASIYQSGDRREVNFIFQFGWDDYANPNFTSGGKIDDIIRTYNNTKRNKLVDARLQDSSIRSVISEEQYVTILDVGLDLDSVGAYLKLKGFCSPAGSSVVFSSVKKTYDGKPSQILHSLCHDYGVQPVWKLDRKELVEKSFSGNKYTCGGKLFGDIVKDLLERMKYKNKADKLFFYFNNEVSAYTESRFRPDLIITPIKEEADADSFLGSFDYFKGNSSSIIGAITFDLGNLYSFFGEIHADTYDTQTKATTGKAKQTINKSGKVVSTNPVTNADKESKYHSKEDIERLKNKVSARLNGSMFPDSGLTSEEMSNIENAVYNTIYNFPIKAKMSTIGDPSLGFKHIGMQAFIELNIFSHQGSGNKIEMLSGLYAIESVSHEINESSFITVYDLMKYNYDSSYKIQRTVGER
jgi:hypothetical protein